MYHHRHTQELPQLFFLHPLCSPYHTASAFYNSQCYSAHEQSSYSMPYQEGYQWTEDAFKIQSWDQQPFSISQNFTPQYSSELSNHSSSYHQNLNSNKTQSRNHTITDAELNREIQKRIKRTLSHLSDKREERLLQARTEASILNTLGEATRHLYLINLKIQEQNKEKNKAIEKAYQEREGAIITYQVRETILAKYSHLPRIHCGSYMPHRPKK